MGGPVVRNSSRRAQTSSIIWHKQAVPPFALDAASNRFAVAGNDTVSVVELTSTSDPPAR